MSKVKKKTDSATKSIGRSLIAKKAKRKSVKKIVKARKLTVANIQYVIPLGNGWVVKSSNSKNFIAITDSKVEAVNIARSLAKTKHTELVVHSKSGKIEKKESYAVKASV